jgi:hypothetical protein
MEHVRERAVAIVGEVCLAVVQRAAFEAACILYVESLPLMVGTRNGAKWPPDFVPDALHARRAD